MRPGSTPPDARTTVVHLITTLTQGGAERVLSQVVPRPSDAPDEHHVVVTLVDGGMFADELTAAGVEVRGLGMRPGRDVVRGTLRFARLLRTLRPILVVSWMYHACLLDLLARPLAGSGRRARMVWFLQGSLESMGSFSRSTRAVIRILARLSWLPTAVAINSVAGRTQHATFGYNPTRWEHLPNGCDTDRFRPDAVDRAAVRASLEIAPGVPAILFVGRHHPEKGTDVLLQALAELGTTTSAVVVLVGTGTETLSGRDGEIRRVGLGVRSDVDRLLRGADLLVLPSRSEGTPNAVIEAMATGVPCVVTDVGDNAALIGPTGLAVPAGSATALSGALRSMLELGPEQRRDLGIEARRRAIERHSVAHARAVYRSLWAVQ